MMDRPRTCADRILAALEIEARTVRWWGSRRQPGHHRQLSERSKSAWSRRTATRTAGSCTGWQEECRLLMKLIFALAYNT